MQRVPLARLRPGMITAGNVYSAEGHVLLSADVALKENYLKRLAQVGILAVYIRNPYFEDVVAPEIISEMTRVKIIQAVQQQFVAIREGKKWDVARFVELANQIVAEVGHNSESMVQLTDIRPHNEFTFGHSVNVAVLSVMIGASMKYTRTKLQEVALGALLHDIGKMKIDPKILNKPAKLTADEFAIMKTHAEQGFEILRQAVPKVMPLKVMHMAFQHQEKPDGTGYPRGLDGNGIHEYARIASVADVYDAITCDRPYHRGLFPHEACMLLAENMGKQFDVDTLTAFLSRVAIYPVGSVVLLSTGDIGVVTQVPWGMQNRPTVRLMLDKQNRALRKKTEVDMREHSNIDITRVLDEEAVFTISKFYE